MRRVAMIALAPFLVGVGLGAAEATEPRSTDGSFLVTESAGHVVRVFKNANDRAPFQAEPIWGPEPPTLHRRRCRRSVIVAIRACGAAPGRLAAAPTNLEPPSRSGGPWPEALCRIFHRDFRPSPTIYNIMYTLYIVGELKGCHRAPRPSARGASVKAGAPKPEGNYPPGKRLKSLIPGKAGSAAPLSITRGASPTRMRVGAAGRGRGYVRLPRRGRDIGGAGAAPFAMLFAAPASVVAIRTAALIIDGRRRGLDITGLAVDGLLIDGFAVNRAGVVGVARVVGRLVAMAVRVDDREPDQPDGGGGEQRLRAHAAAMMARMNGPAILRGLDQARGGKRFRDAAGVDERRGEGWRRQGEGNRGGKRDRASAGSKSGNTQCLSPRDQNVPAKELGSCRPGCNG